MARPRWRLLLLQLQPPAPPLLRIPFPFCCQEKKINLQIDGRNALVSLLCPAFPPQHLSEHLPMLNHEVKFCKIRVHILIFYRVAQVQLNNLDMLSTI